MSGPTLSSPFKNTSTIKKGGATLTYVPASEVVDRLNAVWGPEAWSFTCDVVHLDDTCVVVKGRLVSPLGSVKEGYGGQAIKRMKDGNPVDLGDEFKGAASDALKKAAQHFGVGLYLALGHSPIGVAEAVAGDGGSTRPVSSAPATGREGTRSAHAGTPPAPPSFDADREKVLLQKRHDAMTDSQRILFVKLRAESGIPPLTTATVTEDYARAFRDLIDEARKAAVVADVTGAPA